MSDHEVREPGGPTDRLLSWEKVEDMLGISRSTAWRMQRTGDFPMQVKVSPGRVGWWESELTTWKGARGGVIESPRHRRPRAPRLAGMPRAAPVAKPAAKTAAHTRSDRPALLDLQPVEMASASRPVRKVGRKSGTCPGQTDFGF
ncbi:MAG: AlpA family phage regulatory protein [Brevundimonas sp.]|nr:AlpA family phage regulatory protein [Brevundimonas sp.]